VLFGLWFYYFLILFLSEVGIKIVSISEKKLESVSPSGNFWKKHKIGIILKCFVEFAYEI
jgi:hypothetical protein